MNQKQALKKLNEERENHGSGLSEKVSAVIDCLNECRKSFGWGGSMRQIVNSMLNNATGKCADFDQAKRNFSQEMEKTLHLLNGKSAFTGIRFNAITGEVADKKAKYKTSQFDFEPEIFDGQKFIGICEGLMEECERPEESGESNKRKILNDFIGVIFECVRSYTDPGQFCSENANIRALAAITPRGAKQSPDLYQLSEIVPAIYREGDEKTAAEAFYLYMQYLRELERKISMLPYSTTNLKHLQEADGLFRNWHQKASFLMESPAFCTYVQRKKANFIDKLGDFVRRHEENAKKADLFPYNPAEFREAVQFAKNLIRQLEISDRN